jgi:DNA-binding NarL/FixJ family response regulator
VSYWRTLVREVFDGADRQQPVDRSTARAAAFELAARGLTPRDIGAALRLSESAVRALLKVPS